MSISLNKMMPKLQKPIIRTAVLLSALFIVYSLVYATNLYPLMQISDLLPGAEIYAQVQWFNKLLLNLTVSLLLLSIAMLVFFTQRRRIFYLSNYLTSIIFCVYAVALSIFNFAMQIIYRIKYLAIDFEEYKTITIEESGGRYVKSTFFFDIGFVLSILMLITVAFIIMLLIFKRRLKAETLKARAERAASDLDAQCAEESTAEHYESSDESSTNTNNYTGSKEDTHEGIVKTETEQGER